MDVVHEKLEQVEVVWNALYSDWDETLDELETMLEAHTFARDAKSANTWITNQSSNLTDPPETATLDHIEALLRKFENFERAINAQAERFETFKNTTKYEERESAGRRISVQNHIEEEEETRAKTDSHLAIEIARQLAGLASQWKRRSEVLRDTSTSASWLLAAEEEEALKSVGESTPQFNGVGEDHQQTVQLPRQKELQEDVVAADGTLMRKVIGRRTGDTKALDKTWVRCHVVIKKGSLVIFKDEKALKDDLHLFDEPILHCIIDAESKQKKKFVFRFQSIIGTTYLFQASSQAEMDNWISKIKEVRDRENAEVKHNHSTSSDVISRSSDVISPEKQELIRSTNDISKSSDMIMDNNSSVTSPEKDNTISSEVGSVENHAPKSEKKKSKSLKKKKPSIFRKKRDKIEE